eukprot:gene8209-7757_t
MASQHNFIKDDDFCDRIPEEIVLYRDYSRTNYNKYQLTSSYGEHKLTATANYDNLPTSTKSNYLQPNDYGKNERQPTPNNYNYLPWRQPTFFNYSAATTTSSTSSTAELDDLAN